MWIVVSAQTNPVEPVSPIPGLDFSQFGPFAIVFVLLAAGVVVLWRQQVQAHQRALERIDKLEAELRARNAEDREQLRQVLSELDMLEKTTAPAPRERRRGTKPP